VTGTGRISAAAAGQPTLPESGAEAAAQPVNLPVITLKYRKKKQTESKIPALGLVIFRSSP